MVETEFNGVRCDLQRRRSRIDRAEDLNKRNVEIAQPGLRFLLAVVLLLRLGRQIVLQVPNLMRERAMLRPEQQCRQHNLQQAALQDHLVMPTCGRQPVNRRKLEHNAGQVAKLPLRLLAVSERYILFRPALPRYPPAIAQ
jgi:hypothetical protein